MFSGVDSIDFLMVLGSAFYEIVHGVCSTAEPLMRLREEGGYPIVLRSATDSMSVFTAVKNLQGKLPSEGSTLHHVQWIQELMERQILEALFWTDTRDMISDGMTKGSIARAAIRTAMELGCWKLNHPFQRHHRPRPPPPVDQTTTNYARHRL